MAEIPKSSQKADSFLVAEKRAILEKYNVSNEDMAKILEVSRSEPKNGWKFMIC